MPRKYLVTEDEYLSMRIESDGHLRMTRDNGDIVDAGLALGPAATDADMAGFVADPTSATATQLSATIAEAITDGTNMPFTQGSFVAGKPWVFELSFTLAPGAVTETVGEYV